MKKFILLVILLTYFKLSAQNEHVINFSEDITNLNPLNTINNLVFADARTDQQIGKIPFGKSKEEREIIFNENKEHHFSKWYKIWNTSLTKKENELVFVLKKLKVTPLEVENGKSRAKTEFFAATFLKKSDGYHFITKKDTVMNFTAKNDLSDAVMRIIPALTTNLLRKAFKENYREKAFTYEDVINFDKKIIEENLSLRLTLKDGVYNNFESFSSQLPLQGDFSIKRNKKGVIIGAINNTKSSQIYPFIVVENGIGYVRTLNLEYFPMTKDDEGFYITASRNQIFPEDKNTYLNSGLLPTALNILANDVKDKKLKRNELKNVRIDSYTGEFDFPDENN